MTDGKKLKEAIDGSGVSISFLASKIGCSRNRIYSMIGGSDCTNSEIFKLVELLHMSKNQRDEIFFAKKRE